MPVATVSLKPLNKAPTRPNLRVERQWDVVDLGSQAWITEVKGFLCATP